MQLSAEEIAENAIARKNAFLYAICQSLNGSVAPVSIALGGLTGHYLLGADKSLATLPVTSFNIGVALMALPASMLMRRIGRKHGFMAGSLIGICGVLTAVAALLTHNFWLFALGLLLNGCANSFTQQFRFAAADRGTADFRAKAISWVMIGGIFSAIIGSQLIIFTQNLLDPVPFAGTYLAATLLFIASLFIMNFLSPSVAPGNAEKAAGTGRPLRQILAQPRFLTALLCGIGSYALMSFVMTAAPLAMVGCGFSTSNATLGIQWHVLAMFVPSFFTGNLIRRFGAETIIACGLVLLAICAAVALSGQELAHFWAALVLLGLGWNFAFIGATTMVTQSYRPEEKNKAQGANDFILFSSVAFASLMSGVTLNYYGWNIINGLAFPILALCFAALGWLYLQKPRDPA